MSYNKEDAVRIVVSCAEKYRDELENRMLLFACMNKHKHVSCVEFSFFDYNFLHLTGLKTTKKFMAESKEQLGRNKVTEKISAERFYRKCLDHRLMTSDFEFSDSGTTPMKLEVLPSVICKNLSANMVGDFNSPHPKLYTEKVAGGVNAYMGFVKDAASHMYVPNTVVKEDIRKNVFNYARVITTYRKNITDNRYSEIVYAAKGIDWSKVKFPDGYTYLPKP